VHSACAWLAKILPHPVRLREILELNSNAFSRLRQAYEGNRYQGDLAQWILKSTLPESDRGQPGDEHVGRSPETLEHTEPEPFTYNEESAGAQRADDSPALTWYYYSGMTFVAFVVGLTTAIVYELVDREGSFLGRTLAVGYVGPNACRLSPLLLFSLMHW
jgi:hypothetical protein